MSEFDLESWIVDSLLEGPDFRLQAGQLILRLRHDYPDLPIDELYRRGRTVLSTAIERGWMAVVDVTYAPSPESTWPEGFEEPREVLAERPLPSPDALRRLDDPTLWERTSAFLLSTTAKGEQFLDAKQATT